MRKGFEVRGQKVKIRLWRIGLSMLAGTAIVSAQGQTPSRPGQQGTIFRATANYVSTNVLAKDDKGRFIPDLKQGDFQVFEDGVEQKVENFVAVIGGRALNESTAVAPAPVSEGLILPRTRPPADTSGRIFIIFIDDLHLQALDTPRTRKLLEEIRDTLIHDNDLIGIVSSGYSSLAVDLTYDYEHRRLNEAIHKVMGGAPSPSDVILMSDNSQGVSNLRYNAHVAFSTAYDILDKAAKITDRRKSFIYISSGYDFNPFQDSRYQLEKERYGVPAQLGDANGVAGNTDSGLQYTPDPFQKMGQQFSETDLVAEIAELTRAARRANVTFYPIDPRGLDAGPSIAGNLTAEEWRDFIRITVSSLQVLGDETGGFCICNSNEFIKGLQRIDNETSDYYIIGYNSNNPDPLKARRKIEIRVDRPGAELIYRSEYTLERPKKKT
jgi:VWFA-related protein